MKASKWSARIGSRGNTVFLTTHRTGQIVLLGCGILESGLAGFCCGDCGREHLMAFWGRRRFPPPPPATKIGWRNPARGSVGSWSKRSHTGMWSCASPKILRPWYSHNWSASVKTDANWSIIANLIYFSNSPCGQSQCTMNYRCAIFGSRCAIFVIQTACFHGIHFCPRPQFLNFL